MVNSIHALSYYCHAYYMYDDNGLIIYQQIFFHITVKPVYKIRATLKRPRIGFQDQLLI